MFISLNVEPETPEAQVAGRAARGTRSQGRSGQGGLVGLPAPRGRRSRQQSAFFQLPKRDCITGTLAGRPNFFSLTSLPSAGSPQVRGCPSCGTKPFKVPPDSSFRCRGLVPTRVNRPLLDKTKGISPWIQRIERSFAPWAHDDAAA